MKTHVLLLLVAGLSLVYATAYDYYDDDEPPYRPSYRSRPSPYRRQPRLGSRRFLNYRHPAYYEAAAAEEEEGGGDPVNARALSWGARGKYKGSMAGAADGRVLGQRGGLKGQYAGEGNGEAGMKWSHDVIAGGVKGQNRGSGQGAGMVDTWVGGGSSKVQGAHDVGLDSGFAWDNEDGKDNSGYLGNW